MKHAARTTRELRWTIGALIACAGLALAPGAMAQDKPDAKPVKVGEPETKPGITGAHEHGEVEGDVEPFTAPDMLPAITRLIEQDYWSEGDRRALRIKHGVWTLEDVTDPKILEVSTGVYERARAALTRGAIDDSSLDAEGNHWLTRAEARLARGELDEALALVNEYTQAAQLPSLHSMRLKAQILELQGKPKEADEALSPLVERMGGFRSEKNADEIVEGVRGLMLRARLRGPEKSDGGDFRDMMQMLAYAREELDKLSWSAHLAEAELLYDKDNYAQAVEALQGALQRNPRAAEAWAMLGQMAVDSFDFPRAAAISARLDQLAGPWEKLDTDEFAPGASIDGALVLARARLRQGDPDESKRLLDAALAKHPRSRELLALRAAASALLYDFADCDARLKALDELSPGIAIGYMQVGKALAGQRQYEEAAKYLEVAHDRAPNWVQPAIELGLLEVQSGRNDRALRALEAVEKLDTFNVRAANSLKLMRDLKSFAEIESPHFIVRYRPGDDEALAREMPDVLERIHARVCGDGKGGIRHEPAQKTVIELMPDHRFFAVRITGMPDVHTIAAATGPLVAMESPREGPNHMTGPYDWKRVVQHEYTHTVTLSRTKNRLPHWFTEAAAVYLEDAPRDYVTVTLLNGAHMRDELFDLDGINIGFTRPKKPTDRQLAYAQGHWMYEYIVERFGAEAPLKLMDRYAAGDREGAAFQSVLGLSREKFLADFKAWGATKLVAWGVRPKEGMPTLKELIARDAKAKQEAPKAKGDAATKDEGAESLVAKAEGGDAKPDEPGADSGKGDGPLVMSDEPEDQEDVAAGIRDRIDAWLTEYPEHPEVLRLAVSTKLKDNKGKATAEMVPLLERCAKACPMDPMPRKALAAYYLSGAGSTLPNAAEKLIEPLEFLDVREQHSPMYARELARRYAGMKRWDEAQAKAERAVQISPYDATLREFAAAIALRHDDRTTAERHIRALVILEPDRDLHKQRLEALLKGAGAAK